MNPQLNKHKKQAVQHLLEGIPQLAGGSAAANVKKREIHSELMFLERVQYTPILKRLV